MVTEEYPPCSFLFFFFFFVRYVVLPHGQCVAVSFFFFFLVSYFI